MRDELLLYYERELNYLRQMGAEFAEKYPKIASRLVLDTEKETADPHVERLLEGFAFLAARVHLKIDDEFPEITEALLSILYPHYIRPIPSMSIVEMHLDMEQGGAAAPQKVARGSILNSKPVAGVPCQFQTCFDTTVWPLRITAAEWTSPDRLSPAVKNAEAASAIRIAFEGPQDTQLAQMGVDGLRLHIAADPNVAHTLYELLCANTVQILVRDTTPNSRSTGGTSSWKSAASELMRASPCSHPRRSFQITACCRIFHISGSFLLRCGRVARSVAAGFKNRC